MTARNRELFHAIADRIEQEPLRYDQETYGRAERFDPHYDDCGTAYCVAGWACALTALDHMKWARTGDRRWELAGVEGFGDATGRLIGTHEWATEALGLTRPEARELFAGDLQPGHMGFDSMPDLLRAIAAGYPVERV